MIEGPKAVKIGTGICLFLDWENGFGPLGLGVVTKMGIGNTLAIIKIVIIGHFLSLELKYKVWKEFY